MLTPLNTVSGPSTAKPIAASRVSRQSAFADASPGYTDCAIAQPGAAASVTVGGSDVVVGVVSGAAVASGAAASVVGAGVGAVEVVVVSLTVVVVMSPTVVVVVDSVVVVASGDGGASTVVGVSAGGSWAPAAALGARSAPARTTEVTSVRRAAHAAAVRIPPSPNMAGDCSWYLRRAT